MFATNAFAIASGSACAPDPASASDPASYRFMSIHDEDNAWMHQYISKEEYDAAVRAVADILAAPASAPRHVLPVKRAREVSPTPTIPTSAVPDPSPSSVVAPGGC